MRRARTAVAVAALGTIAAAATVASPVQAGTPTVTVSSTTAATASAAAAPTARETVTPRDTAGRYIYWGSQKVRVTALTPTTARVSWVKFAHGHVQRYAVRYAPDVLWRTDVRTVNASRFARSVVISHPAGTTAATFHFRVYAVGSRGILAQSALLPFQLRVGATPRLSVSGATLRWAPVANTGQVRVLLSQNASFRAAPRVMTVTDPRPGYTVDVPAGSRWWAKVAVRNTNSSTGWSTPVVVTGRRVSAVNVGTYNIRTNNGKLPFTTNRRDLVAHELLTGGYDVVGIQEAWDRSTFFKLYPKLRGRFAYVGSHGERILYNRSKLHVAGKTGQWDIGGSVMPANNATYAVLSNGVSSMLVVNVHLVPQPGARYDRFRDEQMRTVLARAAALNTHAPIVILGDMNSADYLTYTFDGPGRRLLAAGYADASKACAVCRNTAVTSGNHLQSAVSYKGIHIDGIFTPPQVGVRYWALHARISHGRYVGPFPSDHNPLIATLLLPAQSS